MEENFIIQVDASDDNDNSLPEAYLYPPDYDEFGACLISGFELNDYQASWSVLENDKSAIRYHVYSSINGDFGPWVEIGETEYSGLGHYSIPVTIGDEDMLYRLAKVSSGFIRGNLASMILRFNRLADLDSISMLVKLMRNSS